jgi:hypothetical protein
MTAKKQREEKVCRIINYGSDRGYDWARDNRPGGALASNQCIMAVAYGQPTEAPTLIFEMLTGHEMSERQSDAIYTVDGGSATKDDIDAIRRLAAAVGVTIKVTKATPEEFDALFE